MKFERTKPNKYIDVKNKELSAKLGFDVEAMIKPKNMKDFTVILDEAISEIDNLNKLIDFECKRMASEYFNVDDNSFNIYLDEKDKAHIEWLNPEIRKTMLDTKNSNMNPWVEIFTIDPSYCNFKNSNGVIVGRIKLQRHDTDANNWEFISEPINGKEYTFKCTKKYPYACEPEVIKWMVKENLFDTFVNYKI